MNRKHDNLHNCGKMLKISPAIPRRETGFSLIEILLVLTIVGIIVAVVVPRAHRAQVSAKYSIVRQSAAELGTWSIEWAERNLNSQEAADTCATHDYLYTLLGYTGDTAATNNWVIPNVTPTCRNPGTANLIQFSVANIMPSEKQPKNPFNGASYFNTQNGGGTWTAGDLYFYLGSASGTPWSSGEEVEYYFIYHGTDSTAANTWHAGMGNTIPPTSYSNLRNGVFVTRQRVP